MVRVGVAGVGSGVGAGVSSWQVQVVVVGSISNVVAFLEEVCWDCSGLVHVLGVVFDCHNSQVTT